MNWLSTDLYEREGKGQTNFALTMPSDDCELAQQLVKDPQVFEAFGHSYARIFEVLEHEIGRTPRRRKYDTLFNCFPVAPKI